MKICDKCKKRATSKAKVGTGKDANEYDVCDTHLDELQRLVQNWLDDTQKKLEGVD